MVKGSLFAVYKEIWGVDFADEVLVDHCGLEACIELGKVYLRDLESIFMQGLICDHLKQLVPLTYFLQVVFNQVLHYLKMGFKDVFDLRNVWVFIHLFCNYNIQW